MILSFPKIFHESYGWRASKYGPLMNVVFISALRGVVKRHSAASLPSVPSNTEKRGYGPIQLQKTESLFDLIDKIDPIGVVESENPTSMESVGQVFKNFALVAF